MTILERTIAIIFEGDDRSRAAFSAVQQGLNQVEGAVRSVTGPMAELADDILKTEAALFTLSAGTLVYSIAKFVEFEDVMLKVKGIMDLSEDQYTQLTSVVKELGATTRFTATEVAQGLEFMALAGFSFEDSIVALPEVLKLAQAAAMDLGSAADLLTNIMAGYGIKVEDLTRVNDILVATFTNSNTSLSQLGEAMKYVGPVASSLGYEIEHTAAILGVLGNAGYQAEQGGTALRNILITLVSPTQDASKVFEKLGIDTAALGINTKDVSNVFEALGVKVKDASGNLRPMDEILGELKIGLEKIPDPADRAALLMEVFGKRAGPALAALLIQGSDEVVNLENKIDSLGGVATKVAEEMESGMGGALRALKSAFEAIAIEIGQAASTQIQPAVDGVVNVFRTLASEIQKGTFDPLFDAIGVFGADVQKALNDIAKNLPEALEGIEWGGFIDSLEKLKNQAFSLFQAIFPEDLSTAEGLEAAIQKIINAWTTLNNITSGILEAWQPVFGAIGRLIEEFGRAEGPLASFAEHIGYMLGSAQIFDMLIEKFGLVGAVAARMVIDGLDPAQKSLTDLGEIADHANWNLWETRTLGEQLTDAFKNYGGAAKAAADDTKSLGESAAGTSSYLDRMVRDVANLADELKDIPEEKRVEFLVTRHEDLMRMLAEMGWEIEQIPEEIMTKLMLATDSQSFIEAWAELERHIKGEKSVDVIADPDRASIANAAAAIDEAAPEKKVVKVDAEPGIETIRGTQTAIDKVAETRTAVIEVETDEYKLERLKGQLALMQTSVEWQAKLDIAEVEANAQIIAAAFDSISAGLQSSADIITSAIDAISGADLSYTQSVLMENLIREEMRNREKELAMQEKLIDMQIKYMQAKIRALDAGEALIQIDGAGLQPHLEAFMWEVLAAIQTRVNEEGHAMLFGI